LGLDDVLPQLYALAAGIKLTVSLGVAQADGVVTVFSARPPFETGDDGLAGIREAAPTTALSKAVLAFAGTTPDPIAIEDDLELVRQRGFAVSNMTRDGDSAVAVPVFVGRRGVWGALGVHAFTSRLTDDRVAQIVPALQQFAGGVGRTVRKSAVASRD